MKSTWLVGIDIGGTFTDVVALEPVANIVRSSKVLSQTADPVSSIVSACKAVDLKLNEVRDIMHGTTMATNAIVEGRLAPIALIVTKGFADTLEIGRQNRQELYRLDIKPKLQPLVPQTNRIEVDERMDAGGNVVTALSKKEIQELGKKVKRLGVDSVAISLIHSYVNGKHETEIAEGLSKVVPYLALSHQLNPEPREFERTNSTVLNAALMPLVAKYLEHLIGLIAENTRLHLFHSSGGMASVQGIRTRPLALALSGPAAGVSASEAVANELNLSNVISFDMGGTTTDVSIVVDGKAQISSNQRIAGYPVRQLMVAVETIGAGGGSIARLDGEAIRVGPDSAGASPGPASYGLGGKLPTVADANILLGYIDPSKRLGGTVQLDVGKAQKAFAPLVAAFNMAIPQIALGVRRVANANMARALRRVTIEHGLDARSCAVLAFGGAGPMHAVSLARDFGIDTVIVPRFSSVFSALGCMTADMSYAEQRSIHLQSTAWDSAALDDTIREMQERLSEPLLKSGSTLEQLNYEIMGLVRYAGQSDTVNVPLIFPYDTDEINTAFQQVHERLYGFATKEPWEIDTLRITVKVASSLSPVTSDSDAADLSGEPTKIGACWFEGNTKEVTTPFYNRTLLPVNLKINGPAIIEDELSTIVVDPGATVWVDPSGHIRIAVGEART